MQAIEFDAIIADQAIPLPKSVFLTGGQTVRVVVMFDPPNAMDDAKPHEGAIARLSRNPLVIKGFTALSRDEAHER
ncbi:hypothetical protein [uncultured Thiodictyon sp.]|uniref:hypothetical protein n=1 Tax=uncultured Thiodictyon sp. TaxID=1846217 RepID=UPI00260112B8|nr:hypothetical protein [uncultured Thiodictyon sp.]